ncbi:whirlin isoform X5 [Bemisia tabaci]|uniref:whirlin isoform X5 n=1 Tax=Bemisia tabaci TaxID=7038 RepID=UPI0008F9C464|nr:PREDICTED: whirlin isoform X5 [Bemisia tabaci]
MADEEFAELAEIHLSKPYGEREREAQWGGGGSGGFGLGLGIGGRSPSNNTGSLSHQRCTSICTPQLARAAEAEDILGSYRAGHGGAAARRSGMYYSPPGTSYTIVERATPAPQNKHLRGSYLGTATGPGTGASTPAHHTPPPAFSTAHTKSKPNKQSALSPEQVIKLLGGSTSHKGSPGPAGPPGSPPERERPILPPPPTLDQLTTRTVNMSRSADAGHGFGICVKGGIKDSGVGVYISRVEEGSVAERAGLRPGDSILEVNGTPFTSISHEEALKEYVDDSGYASKPRNSESLKAKIAEMLKSSRHLSMTVRSPNTPVQNSLGSNQGGLFLLRQSYSWMDRQGRPCSPPPEYQTPVQPSHQKFYPRPHKDKIRKVELIIEPGQSLGLMIRGGVEYNLGIFVTGVDKDSVADRAGVLVGDQILEVNGQSFCEVTHDEAVGTLKHYKRMTLTVRDCGKVPHSCTSYDTRQTSVRHSTLSGKSAASQMVDEKARIVLRKSEFSTLCYYLEEYNAQRMSVESFVSVLTELLNTPDKYTLLTELREVVAPQDRTMFDELVYGQGLRDSSHTNSLSRNRVDATHSLLPAQLQNPPGLGFGDLDGVEFTSNRSRRRSSLDEGLSRLQDSPHGDANMLARSHGRNYGISDEEELLLGGDKREDQWHSRPELNNSIMENEAHVVPDNQGNLRIKVKKTKPLLGIAIEGGANTKHPLPRIINIHDNGAAFDAGGLEVGQLILEVDGRKVEGMQHQEVARLIAESFARRDVNYIEFLVIEAKKSNLEPKPTALIFLES